jgi:hypothetical protein
MCSKRGVLDTQRLPYLPIWRRRVEYSASVRHVRSVYISLFILHWSKLTRSNLSFLAKKNGLESGQIFRGNLNLAYIKVSCISEPYFKGFVKPSQARCLENLSDF